MITIYQAAKLCSNIYSPIPANVFATVFQKDQVTCGHSVIDSVTAITFAGSECAVDWLRDLKSIPINHSTLGMIHAGFWIGMQDTFEALKPLLVGPIAIQGHSLGAAHAAILAGLCATEGIAVNQLTLLAPPRVSFEELRDIVTGWVPNINAFRNDVDPVTEVPNGLWFERWVSMHELTMLGIRPDSWVEDIDPIAYHDIALYVKGIEALYGS